MTVFHLKSLATFLLSALMFMSFVEPPALLEFDKMEHNFGEIVQGLPQKAVFEISNHGEEPLLITKVKGSCGCTATAYSREPIAPGETSEIEATYNAKNVGQFTKTVSVYTNLQEEPYVLTIRGKVVEE